MPMFEYTARAPSGQIQKGQLDAPSKDEVSAYLRKNRLILVSVREAAQADQPQLRRRPHQDARHRHLHPAVRDDDQRGPAAGAVAQHPGPADREQGAEGRHQGGGVRRRVGPHAGRRVVQASQGLHRSLRQHGRGGRGGRYPRHHPAPSGHLPGEERRPGPQGEGRHGLPGRHHQRRGDRHRGAARLRDPDLREHVLLGRAWSCRCPPGS